MIDGRFQTRILPPIVQAKVAGSSQNAAAALASLLAAERHFAVASTKGLRGAGALEAADSADVVPDFGD